MDQKTLDYYNSNAEKFAQDTYKADMHDTQNHFLFALQKAFPGKSSTQLKILDFGCGAGRDTKAFLTLGYQVDACDGSSELVKKAREYTGIDVKQMLFTELDAENAYEGIWACSSILHCDQEELVVVLHKIEEALKQNGILYTSFKYGSGTRERNGRFFMDYTEESFDALLKKTVHLKLIQQWVTTDVRPGRENEKWLNVLLKKEGE